MSGPDEAALPETALLEVALLEANQRAATLFSDGQLREAADLWERIIAELTPADDGRAPAIYENLGLAYTNLGRWDAAIRAFRRALDGDWGSREQSARFLVSVLVRRGRGLDARTAFGRYEACHGTYPDAWVRGALGGDVTDPPEGREVAVQGRESNS